MLRPGLPSVSQILVVCIRAAASDDVQTESGVMLPPGLSSVSKILSVCIRAALGDGVPHRPVLSDGVLVCCSRWICGYAFVQACGLAPGLQRVRLRKPPKRASTLGWLV